MNASIDIWKSLAGLALFLFGMRLIEESLKKLSGRRFKLFLKRQTAGKWRAIGGGALVTAVLQSSSLVGLMTLAFVGTGVLTMPRALAVVMGANLGSAFSNWIVAVFGFTIGIENLSLPVIAVAGLCLTLTGRETRFHRWSQFLLGLSFLFFGLGYIKSGIEQVVLTADLEIFARSPLIVFFLIGLVVTSVIQSSSATMAITMGALFAHAITLVDAMAVVAGSEIGTTVKLFLASMNGQAAKRRVALGNLIFNGLVSLAMLFFLSPVAHLLTATLCIQNPVIALVAFQTLVNLSGILVFFPFLDPFGRFLERRFRDRAEEPLFIHKVSHDEPSVAIYAMENECGRFLLRTLGFIRQSFHLPPSGLPETDRVFRDKKPLAQYEQLKNVNGEIHSFAARLQLHLTDAEDQGRAERVVAAVRNAMYAAKSIKDALPDLVVLSESSNDTKYAYYLTAQAVTGQVCNGITELLRDRPVDASTRLAKLYSSVTTGYTGSLQHLYRTSTTVQVREADISTMLNFNREVVTAFKSLVFAVKDYLLDREAARYFEEQPGFIH